MPSAVRFPPLRFPFIPKLLAPGVTGLNVITGPLSGYSVDVDVLMDCKRVEDGVVGVPKFNIARLLTGVLPILGFEPDRIDGEDECDDESSNTTATVNTQSHNSFHAHTHTQTSHKHCIALHPNAGGVLVLVTGDERLFVLALEFKLPTGGSNRG